MMNRRTHQQGLSIIELMVAVALSSLLLFGVLNIFDGTKRSTQIANSFSRVQEGGRIATEMMSRDIRMADYWGCAADSSKITDHIDPTEFPAEMNPTNQKGVDGEDDVGSSEDIDGRPIKPGTDTLILRGASSVPNAKIIQPMPTTSAIIKLANGADIPEGTVVLISDCNMADMFTNTFDKTAHNGELQHNTGTNHAGPDNKTKNLSQKYGPDAQIMRPFVKTYFIGEAATGVWSLYRRENNQTHELIRDVEDLQIFYGEDTNNDGSVDDYGDADEVNMDRVISIRVEMLVSSANSAGADAMSRTYTVTSNIRNRSL